MISVKFSRKIYSRASICSALAYFKGGRIIQDKSEKDYYCVDIGSPQDGGDISSLVDEFKNYVLYLDIIHEGR
jgi:hypothetical protein